MVRKVLLVLSWFPLSVTVLIIFLYYLNTMSVSVLAKNNDPKPYYNYDISSSAQYEVEPGVAVAGETAQVLSATVTAGDARNLLLSTFLEKHDSPMAPFADDIVKEADLNNIDFKLVPAIAMCESNLGKRMPSSDSHNAWGISVYTGQTSGATFKNWPQAISWVSKYVKEKYIDRGVTDLREIGSIWAPPSVHTGYSWTNCVETFLAEIQ
jgi:hypothetical protein